GGSDRAEDAARVEGTAPNREVAARARDRSGSGGRGDNRSKRRDARAIVQVDGRGVGLRAGDAIAVRERGSGGLDRLVPRRIQAGGVEQPLADGGREVLS